MNKKLIKLLCLALVVALSVSLITIPAMAQENVRVVLNGEELTFDVPPQIIDNRTMVPMRAIFEALGADVEWDGDTRTVTATQNDTIIIMQINNVVISVNDEDITLDVPPLLVDNRTLVPVRAVAEGLNADVDWDGETRTVIITSEDPTTGGNEALRIIFGRHEFGADVRYFFEQARFPQIVFGYQEEFIDLIVTGDAEEIEEVIREEWYFISAGKIADYLMELDDRYSLDNMPQLIESIAEKRVELGLGEEHIVSVTLEQLNSGTRAIIIEMYYTGLPLLSSFIAIAYNETAGLNYFTLERSIDLAGDGNVPYMFCFVDPPARGTLSVIANNRAAFINAVRTTMTDSVTATAPALSLSATITVMEVGPTATANRDKDIMASVSVYNDSGENVTSQFHFGRITLTRGTQTITGNINRQADEHVFNFTANWNPGQTADVTVEVREAGGDFVELTARNVRIYDMAQALQNMLQALNPNITVTVS